MEYAVMAGLLLLIALLLITLLRARKNDYQGLALHMARKERDHFGVLRPCPLCHSMLKRGENLKTRVIEIHGSTRGGASGVVDRLADVQGCPYCWPGNTEHPRTCPSCGRTLELAETVQARYFERTEGKNHLRILGCSGCRHTKM